MNEFYKVSYKSKEFVRDFIKNEQAESTPETPTTETQTNFIADISFNPTTLPRNGFTPVKFYDFADGRYAYCNNYYIKKVYQGVFTSVSIYSDYLPLIAPIVYNGEKQFLVVGKRNSQVRALVGSTEVTGVPFGVSCAIAAGRLFIGDKNRVYFSREFAYTDFTGGGFIDLDKDDGDIVFLAEAEGVLYVLCKHSVYKLSPLGEKYDFNLKKINSCYIDVRENSVCECFDTIFFTSGDTVFSLIDGKVKQVGEKLKFKTFTNGIAGTSDGLYLLPVTISGENFVYFYDQITGTENLKSAGDRIVTGKYAFKTTDGVIARIEKTVTEETVVLNSVAENDSVETSETETEDTEDYDGEYDFGTCLKKAVTRVEAHITGSATISIVGDGFKTATLTEKCNSFSCFIHGQSFSVTFTNRSADFSVVKLKIKYVVYGGEL